MKIKFVNIFTCVTYLIVGALAEDEIKRGTFPFMAFIYYQDEAILSPGGGRFLQGAVLVRPTFLISASLKSTISMDPLRKTLLARLGATVIDPKLTYNEDEDEQEQEVIQITQPYEHDTNRSWLTDISLLKTLQSFTMTNFVRYTQLSTKQDVADKACHVLIFKKKSDTDVRMLTRLYVDMLPPTQDNCGEKFVPETMRCATVQAASDGLSLASDFCQGNSGGPLMCDTDVIALQTYINDDCKSPHLYQLLSPKKRFLDCGIEEKCDKESCQHVCTVIHKDAPPTLTRTTLNATTEHVLSETPEIKIVSEATTPMSTTTTTEATTKTTVSDSPSTTLSTLMDTTPYLMVANSTVMNTSSSLTDTVSDFTTKPWPIERDGRKSNDLETDTLNRTVVVQAQSVQAQSVPAQSRAVVPRSRHIQRSSKANTGKINLIVFHFAYSVLCILS